VPTSPATSEVSRADALRFVIDAYDGVGTRSGKGLKHARAAANALRGAGCSELAQIVALLHDVVEDTPRTVDDVREAFGEPVASMVDALTEDAAISQYAQRKRTLRSRIVAAGSPVLEVAIADKIASLRDALVTDKPISKRKLAHYRATLQLAFAAGANDLLCTQLEDLLTVATHRW
jgi:(p)ppGpp synthase/HD superfamily hydrolase